MSAGPVAVGARPIRGGSLGFVRATLLSTEGRLAAVLLVLMALLILIGPLIAPYPPTRPLSGRRSSGPSADHLLGTDSLGRDVASRVLSGGRDVIWLPFLGIVLAFALGGVLAVIAGYRRGWVDVVFTRAHGSQASHCRRSCSCC